MKEHVRLIALYLPQFHPIPENDAWWTPGFTEWTNVARARPLFPGHRQPRIPAELGFYDLRVVETRERQANLAQSHGINGFCYYHYWFGGKLLLERPAEEMLALGRPDFPFCFCWANENWTARWVGRPDEVLVRQDYPGADDHRAHVEYLAPFFSDSRYLQVDGRSLFLILRPLGIPSVEAAIAFWRRLAIDHTGRDLFLVGIGTGPDVDRILSLGFDGVVVPGLSSAVADYLSCSRRVGHLLAHRLLRLPRWVISYRKLMKHLVRDEWQHPSVFPEVTPNWDNSPRVGRQALVVRDSNPSLFAEVLGQAVEAVRDRGRDRRLVVLKAWNEWAEGNYVEPDLSSGRAYLKAIASVAEAVSEQ